MSSSSEVSDVASRRARQGKLVAAIAIAWWIASVGGIIWVINSQ